MQVLTAATAVVATPGCVPEVCEAEAPAALLAQSGARAVEHVRVALNEALSRAIAGAPPSAGAGETASSASAHEGGDAPDAKRARED